MSEIVLMSHVIVALGILNVWLVRAGRATAWRGGGAKTLREEFLTYGLPGWAVTVVGAAKITLAVLLLVGLWMPGVGKPAAMGVSALMMGAIVMHMKVGDPVRKSLPALAMLTLSLVAVMR
ncbi:MAG: hypothetical protein RL328_1624 [Acidobacteriota bacterium]